MSDSWFVVPETKRLALPGGQFIDVKKRLTYGEDRAAHAAIIKEMRQDGRITPDMEMIELAQVAAYLVDWSLADGSGTPVEIDTEAKKIAALQALAPEKFALIKEAIDAHVDAAEKARSAEKNGQAGGNTSSTTSPSAG